MTLRRETASMISDTSLPDLRERLRENAEAVRTAVHNRGAKNPRVFGSVARGDYTANSDIDVLVDAGSTLSLLGIVQLEEDLEKLLGVAVDVVVGIEIPKADWPAISREALPI